MTFFQTLVLFSLLPVVNQDQMQEHFCENTPENFEKVDPVKTTPGKNITLQCITTFPLEATSIVEWSKGELEIFTVIDGKEKIHDESFKGRLRLAVFRGNLSGCIASLNISHVKNSDEGSYHCCIKCPESDKRSCTNLTLVVKNETDTGQINTGKQGGNLPNSSTTSSPQNETKNCPSFSDSSVCFGVDFVVGLVVGFGFGFGAGITALYFIRKQKKANRGSNEPSGQPLVETSTNPREKRTSQENEGIV